MATVCVLRLEPVCSAISVCSANCCWPGRCSRAQRDPRVLQLGVEPLICASQLGHLQPRGKLARLDLVKAVWCGQLGLRRRAPGPALTNFISTIKSPRAAQKRAARELERPTLTNEVYVCIWLVFYDATGRYRTSGCVPRGIARMERPPNGRP